MDQLQAWFHMIAYLIDRGRPANYFQLSVIWYSVFQHDYFIKSIFISCASQKL